jgi:uncharacterized membrane protein
VTGNLNNSAYHWSASTGKTLIESPNNYVLSAHDISADGNLVVGTSDNDQQAFRWTATSGTEGLGGLEVNGVSADGHVVVGQVSTGVAPTNGAAFWTESDGWTS